jgi:hypothetical protein
MGKNMASQRFAIFVFKINVNRKIAKDAKKETFRGGQSFCSAVAYPNHLNVSKSLFSDRRRA